MNEMSYECRPKQNQSNPNPFYGSAKPKKLNIQPVITQNWRHCGDFKQTSGKKHDLLNIRIPFFQIVLY